jgi:hypothetical protein
MIQVISSDKILAVGQQSKEEFRETGSDMPITTMHVSDACAKWPTLALALVFTLL